MADFGSDESKPLVVDLQERQGAAITGSSVAAIIHRRTFTRGPPPASWRRFYITRTEGTRLIGTCLLCSEYIHATAGVSSNLLRHLKRKHPRELEIALHLQDGKQRKVGPTTTSSSSSSVSQVPVSSASGDVLGRSALPPPVPYERPALQMAPGSVGSSSATVFMTTMHDSSSTGSYILSDMPHDAVDDQNNSLRLAWSLDSLNTSMTPSFVQSQPNNEMTVQTVSRYPAITTNDCATTSSVDSPGTSSATASPSVVVDSHDGPRSRRNEINDAVLGLVWRDLEPFEVVNRPGFLQLMKATAPDYDPPTAEKMADVLLPRRLDQLREALSPSIGKAAADSVSAIIGVWLGESDDVYASVDVSYATRHFRTETKTVAFRRVAADQDAADAVRDVFESALQRWNVDKNRIMRVLVDSPARTAKTFSFPGWTSDSSHGGGQGGVSTRSPDSGEFDLSHEILEELDSSGQDWSISSNYRLHCALRSAFDVDQDVVSLVARCSRVVSGIKASARDAATVAGATGVSFPFPSSYSDEWTSQLDCLRELCSVFTQHADLQERIYACKEVGLTTNDVALLQDLLEVLAPLEEATNALRQPQETVGLVLPALRNLQVSLTRAVARDGFQLKTMAENLLRNMETHFGRSWNDPVLLAGALLDPRFKVAWCDGQTACKMKEAIEKQRAALNLHSPPALAVQRRDADAGNKGQKLFRNIRNLDTSSTQQPGPTTPLGQELCLYLSEDTTEDTVTPLGYWKANQPRFPILARLALSVFAVGGTPATVDEVASVAAAIQAARRNRFTDEQLEQVVLLRRHLM
ncbi:zinc finger BED domain-containing protein 4-like [Dermacentor andersoni]|uniref:zinc finger BED domain-containing protein 4-like n=1 Tax=Dermacentor andersoni TaxID=34620 RepID=UPI003B3AF292